MDCEYSKCILAKKLALGKGAATFVYADADDATAKGLRSWADDHRPLWSALREREIAERRRIEEAISEVDSTVLSEYGGADPGGGRKPGWDSR